jgi:hypothetical protein
LPDKADLIEKFQSIRLQYMLFKFDSLHIHPVAEHRSRMRHIAVTILGFICEQSLKMLLPFCLIARARKPVAGTGPFEAEFFEALLSIKGQLALCLKCALRGGPAV